MHIHVIQCHTTAECTGLPEYATEQSAGLDLCAGQPSKTHPWRVATDVTRLVEKYNPAKPLRLFPGERVLIPTGVRLALPAGLEAQVRPRSGLALKQGLTVLNSPGTIDADYRGDVGVILINHGTLPAVIRPGDRIAQLVVAPMARVELTPVEVLDTTVRGSGGFGSTGV